MGWRSAIPVIASATVLLGVYPHAARAEGVSVTISVAGIRYQGEGTLQLDGRYLDGEAKRGDKIFYFDASLRDDVWTVHVSTSPKPGGYPSCWIEGTGSESGGRIAITLSAGWACAGGAAAIEIDLPDSP